MHLCWPVEKFDEVKSEIQSKQRADKLHEDYCRLIEQQGNDINEVFIWAQLAKVELTIERFHRELANQSSR